MNTMGFIQTGQLKRKAKRNGCVSLPLKKLAEVLAGTNTCLQQLALSAHYQPPTDSAFDRNGWQAEHQPGVVGLEDFLREHFPCREVWQEVWLPEVLLGGVMLTGKADVVAILDFQSVCGVAVLEPQVVEATIDDLFAY